MYQKRSATPILFNLYSEYMMKDALEEAEVLQLMDRISITFAMQMAPCS